LQSSVTTCKPIINEQIGMNLLMADNNNSVTYLLLLILARRPYRIVGSHAYESLKYWNNRGHASRTNHCALASLKSFI